MFLCSHNYSAAFYLFKENGGITMELILDKVSRQYGTKMACSNICLRLTPGVYGLLGANGAGKNHANAHDMRSIKAYQRYHYF